MPRCLWVPSCQGFRGQAGIGCFPRNPSFLFAGAQTMPPFPASEKPRPSDLCTAPKRYGLGGLGAGVGELRLHCVTLRKSHRYPCPQTPDLPTTWAWSSSGPSPWWEVRRRRGGWLQFSAEGQPKWFWAVALGG